MDTELAKKMIARADADNLHQDHEMRVLAAKFEFAATNLDREDGAKRCWVVGPEQSDAGAITLASR
ncbi:hypothetical protein HFM15_002399 [Vibrio cholerae]|nr:hypothetical protein [Vibrio cholerae]